MVDARLNTHFVNRRLAEMLGYSAQEIGERSILSFVEPGHGLELQEILSLEQPDRRGDGREVKLRRRDGSTLWASVQTSRMVDETGA